MFPENRDKTALIYDNCEISYSEVISGIFRFAGTYSVARDERVAVFADNSPEWIYAFYSAWVHGAIAVPLDAAMTSDELASVLNDCRPSVIFCSNAGKALVDAAVIGIPDYLPSIFVMCDVSASVQIPVLFPEIKIHSTAVIIYTSGTTGNKKGVMLSYDNLMASIEAIAAPRMLTGEDVMIGLLPFHHIFPLQGTILAPLYLGATVVIVKNLVAEEILSALRKYRVTIFLGVPRLYELLHGGIMKKIMASLPARLLFLIARRINSRGLGRIIFSKVHDSFGGNVHAYLVGGAKMSPEVCGNLWAIGFRLVEGYGLTETSPLVAFNPYERIKQGSVGRIFPGVEVRIQNGEIIVRGRNVMSGYYNNPEATGRILKDGWFYTGDSGYFDDDGYLYLTGRKDDMIVLPNGKNIDPEEIENTIRGLSPLVKDIGIINFHGNLMALIYPDFEIIRSENIINITESLKYMVLDRYNRSVSNYKKILKFSVSQRELPRTRLGKLRRFLLPELISEKKVKISNLPEPEGEEYSILKSYLEDLKKTTVHPDDHIELDLGIDSLDRVELASFIEIRFGINLSVEEIASHSLVKEMAMFIEANKNKAESGESDIDWKKILMVNSGSSVVPVTSDSLLLQRIIRIIFKFPLKLYFRLNVEMRDDIKTHAIISPNHQSIIDTLLLIITLPVPVLRKTAIIAKDKKIYHRRVISYLIKKLNVEIIDINGDIRLSLQKAVAILLGGYNVVIFPEGERSRNGELSPFKKAFAILSKELGIPVIPVVIDGSYKALPIGKIFPRPVRITLRYLQPVNPEGKNYTEIIDEVMHDIQVSLETHRN